MNRVVSIVIPSRNEKFLHRTIEDLLDKATGEIEIIPVLDGYWPPINELINDKRVHYLHFSTSRGMRNAINSGVAISQGDYIFKIDAHCMVDRGYDEALKADCEASWVVVPRRYRLDPEKWEVINDGRPPVDYEYIDAGDLHGVRWEEKAQERQDVLIDDIISAQGSGWFMHKKYFNDLELLDEKSYGTFFLEFQEISFKSWLSGGRVVVNKKTWYAHYHKTKGRGYNLENSERDRAVDFMNKWKTNKAWKKQTKPFDYLINKFMPMPGWG